MRTEGRNRTVSDAELVQAIRDHPDPAVKTTELADDLPIGSTRVNQLLGPLEDAGILKSKDFGSGKGWWVRRRVKEQP